MHISSENFMKNVLSACLLGLIFALIATGCSSNAGDVLESERIALDSMHKAMVMTHDTLAIGERRRHSDSDSLHAVFEAGHEAVLMAQAEILARIDSLVRKHARMELAHSTSRMAADAIRADHDLMESEHTAMKADYAKLATDLQRITDEHAKRIADRAAAEAAAKAAAAAAANPVPVEVPGLAQPVVDPAQH
jgi:hypothetical protein